MEEIVIGQDMVVDGKEKDEAESCQEAGDKSMANLLTPKGMCTPELVFTKILSKIIFFSLKF